MSCRVRTVIRNRTAAFIALASKRPTLLVNRFAVLWPWAVWYKGGQRGVFYVFKRLTIVACVVCFGFTVGGCTKCGFWWDDWVKRPASCKGDFPK